MEKISHIVPASTRQVWVSGEIEKPKRVSEPTLEDRAQAARLHRVEPMPVSQSTEGTSMVSGDPLRGGKLNTMA